MITTDALKIYFGWVLGSVELGIESEVSERLEKIIFQSADLKEVFLGVWKLKDMEMDKKRKNI